MAKKKKTIQLLPFDYLVKIGRIKKTKALHSGFIGNKGIYIPTEMKEDWRKYEKYLSKPKASSGQTIYTDAGWWVQKNWLKP